MEMLFQSELLTKQIHVACIWLDLITNLDSTLDFIKLMYVMIVKILLEISNNHSRRIVRYVLTKLPVIYFTVRIFNGLIFKGEAI